MSNSKIQRSLRLPWDLVKWLEREGQANERNVTKQVTYILRRVQKEESRGKKKVSA